MLTAFAMAMAFWADFDVYTAACACATFQADPVELKHPVVSMNVGDSFDIPLCAALGSGYMWVAEYPDEWLSYDESLIQALDPLRKDGSASEFVMNFTGKQIGSGDVVILYKRGFIPEERARCSVVIPFRIVEEF
jgi:hypothetical protein